MYLFSVMPAVCLSMSICAGRELMQSGFGVGVNELLLLRQGNEMTRIESPSVIIAVSLLVLWNATTTTIGGSTAAAVISHSSHTHAPPI